MTDFLPYNSLYGNIYYTYNDFNSIDKNLAGLHSFEDIEGIVNKFNIRYVVFRKDLSSSGYVNADELSLLHNELIKKTKLIVSNEYLDIFDFGAEEPQINGENLYYEEINPIKYKIYVKNITSTQELSFLESLNDGWKLYIDQNPTNSWCEQSQGYDNDVVECQPKQKFFEGEELTYLYKKPIFDNTHSLIDGYANGWIIDPNYIKQNFDPSYYKENPDGSIDIELTLYFKPQSYFDLGLIISGATLLACLGYLGWDFTRRRKKKLAATTTIKKEEDV
jgi:hypothetical protein